MKSHGHFAFNALIWQYSEHYQKITAPESSRPLHVYMHKNMWNSIKICRKEGGAPHDIITTKVCLNFQC